MHSSDLLSSVLAEDQLPSHPVFLKEESEGMASNPSDMRCQAGQAAGRAQVKKDEMMDKASQAKDQSGNYMQETGDQMKNMAQGATDAVKNAMGKGDSRSSAKK